MSQYKIDTVEQLENHQVKVKTALDEKISQRAVLYRQFRTVAVQSDPERKDQVKQEISTLTGQIKKLRREVELCKDISQRSEKMRENLEQKQMESRNKNHVRERS